MENIYLEKISKLKKNIEMLERKLSVKFTISGRQVAIEGEPVDEYEAYTVLDAMNFGFETKDALTLTNESFIFRKLNIKDYTRRKDLEEVRGRIIGTEGKTKRTFENVSGCAIVINENTVGLIGSAESIEEATTALINLIHGTKQSNIYRFLEKMNAAKREKIDLGLKYKEK